MLRQSNYQNWLKTIKSTVAKTKCCKSTAQHTRFLNLIMGIGAIGHWWFMSLFVTYQMHQESTQNHCLKLQQQHTTTPEDARALCHVEGCQGVLGWGEGVLGGTGGVRGCQGVLGWDIGIRYLLQTTRITTNYISPHWNTDNCTLSQWNTAYCAFPHGEIQ